MLQKKGPITTKQRMKTASKSLLEDISDISGVKKTLSSATEVKTSRLNYIDANVQTDPHLDPLSQWSPVSFILTFYWL